MNLTAGQLKEKLPVREFWFSKEIADALGVSSRTVQYAAKRKAIGRKVRQGPRGTYVFIGDDLEMLLQHIHGEVGNPIKIANSRLKRKKRLDAVAVQDGNCKIGRT